MYRFLFLALLAAAITSCKKNQPDDQAIANNKSVSWIKAYGGTNYDFAKSIVQLSNGDYVMAGTSRSSDGDIPGNRFGYDTWLAKVDTSGNLIWSQAYGTGADEHTTNLIATNDGGFLVTGHIGWNFDTTSNQAWVIKANSSGQQVWRKDFTASTDSKITDVVTMADGNFIAIGYTTTTNGRDGWIIKLDANGSQLWAKAYGGTKEDQFASIVPAAGGGYVLAGYSSSNSSDVTENRGGFDGWVVKISDDGGLQWSKTFGGSGADHLRHIIATTDGGYLSVGNSTSSNGDVSLNRGRFDEWVVKFDASGNKQWTKTYGGTNDEYVTAVVATNDGGYISIGYTNSTNYDVTRFSGDFGGWLIKMDANGNKTASSTYGYEYDELVDDIITTKDGGYMIAGQTFNPAKQYDAWLIKINPF